MSEDIEAFLRLDKLRRYSAFFEADSKERKELGVGAELVRSLRSRFGIEVNDLHPPSKDPPDLVATVSGQDIAIELTELVCLDAVRANQKAKGSEGAVYRHWKLGEVRAALAERLLSKDTRVLNNGPFYEYWVCVHTDEFELSPERVKQDLADGDLGRYSQINRAFLLFSYQPGQSSYPLVELPLRR